MKERTEKTLTGSDRAKLTEAYQTCESQRTERLLLIELDFSKQPTEISCENYTVDEFAKSIINLAEERECETVEHYKEFYNEIVSEEDAKATLITIINPQGEPCSLISEIDMDCEEFIDKVGFFFLCNAALKRENKIIAANTSKHDTWIKLVPDSPFKVIENLFPQGFPMRDPFPMGISSETDRTIQAPEFIRGARPYQDEHQIKLWHLDMNRLNDDQVEAIAEILAAKFSVDKRIILADAAINGLLIEHKWVEKMSGGAENYQRTLELANFLEAHPDPNAEDLASFIRQQTEDWIDGDRVPDPLPEKYEDVDPRIQHEQLEEVYEAKEFFEWLGIPLEECN